MQSDKRCKRHTRSRILENRQVIALHEIQPLEPRMLLSISSSILGGPQTTVGNTWTYSYVGETTSDTVSIVGATTFGGQPAFERDTTETSPASDGSSSSSSVAKDYLAQTSTGLVDYNQTNSNYGSDGSLNSYNSHLFEPAEVIIPPTLEVGQPVTVTTVDTFTVTDYTQNDQITTITRNISNTGTLVSDTPSPLTVPAGTFDCYQVDQTLIWTQDTGTTTINETVYLATGVGIVEIDETDTENNGDGGGGSGSSVKQLTSFTGNDRLVFTQQPSNAQAEDPIKPAITVSVEDSTGDVETDATGTVTLNPIGVNADNPITGNTATLVNGVATFSDVVLTQAGVYQLQASDTADDTVGTSNKFGVGGDKLEFIGQPKNVDVQTPIPVKIEAFTPKGKKDTDLTDTIQLSLNIISGGNNAVLDGTTTADLVDGIATFPADAAPTVNSAGTYTLTATPQSDDGTDYTVSSAASNKFKTAGPTLKEIVGKVGSQKQTSTDDDLTITNANAMALAQSDGEMSLTASGMSPSTSKILAKIQWAVVRNTDDIATGEIPSITQNPDDPLEATVSLNGAGSFNVICYYDENDNSTYDPGEELKVFHLAEVGVVINPSASSVTTDNSNFASRPYDNLVTVIQDGSFAGPFAIQMSETVQVIGGGADGMIGVDKIHLGYLQNGTSNNVTVNYQNGRTARERLDKGTFPILDATYSPNSRDPYAIFTLPSADLKNPDKSGPGPLRDPVTNPSDPFGGQDRTVETADSPTMEFLNTNDGSPASSTSGSENFVAYLSAYSDDFNNSFVGDLSIHWTETFSFQQILSHWVNTGSNVTSQVSVLPTPTSLQSLGVKLNGPLYANDVETR